MNDWMARISLNRHPLLRGIHDACQAVEVCGASTALTSAVTKVGDLMEPARVLLDERDSLRAEVAQARAELQAAQAVLRTVANAFPPPEVMRELEPDNGDKTKRSYQGTLTQAIIERMYEQAHPTPAQEGSDGL